jgi:hypothetical protein
MPAFGLLGIDFGHGFDALQDKQWMGKLYYWTTILKKLIYNFLKHML